MDSFLQQTVFPLIIVWQVYPYHMSAYSLALVGIGYLLRGVSR